MRHFEEAATAYAQLLSDLQPDHWSTPLVLGEYGWVLTELGRLDEAGEHYAHAVRVEEAQAPDAMTNGVIMARYFLAENLSSLNEPRLALDALAPCLATSLTPKFECLLRTSEALALLQLGQRDAATRAATRAYDLAPTSEHRQAIVKRLPELLASR